MNLNLKSLIVNRLHVTVPHLTQQIQWVGLERLKGEAAVTKSLLLFRRSGPEPEPGTRTRNQEPEPGLTAPSSAQAEAPVAGSPRPTTRLRLSSPLELCSFSSSSPSSPSSSWSTSLPPSRRLLPPSSLPSSFSSSSCPRRWRPGLPSYVSVESSPHSDRLDTEK